MKFESAGVADFGFLGSLMAWFGQLALEGRDERRNEQRMFSSKRQERQKRLRKLSPQDWETLPEFLIGWHEHFMEFKDDEFGEYVMLQGAKLVSKSADPKFRDDAHQIWLDHAEESPGFAKRLDRLLGLRTDQEDTQYQEHWATKRNKVYVWFAFLAFAISIASLIVSLIALGKSS